MATSINTNVGALVALNNLVNTSLQLEIVQRRVSTGYNVADAFDNGALFGVAQNIRNDISGVGAANQQLGAAKGLLSVANAAATAISTSLSDVRDVLTRLSDTNITSDARNGFQVQYNNLISNIQSFINNATYNGKNILTGTAVTVIANVSAGQLTVSASNLTTGVYGQLTGTLALSGATGAAGFLTSTFTTVQSVVSTILNSIGGDNSRVTAQISFNTAISDAFTVGLGALVDADLAKESAKLQSLQIQQQLSSQSLAISNQAPAVLLALFSNR